MSNQACLFAEDTPTPHDPFAKVSKAGTNTVYIAGAAYQIPVFWLSCFDRSDIVMVGSGDGEFPSLVGQMAQVHSRLAERAARVNDLFPAYAGAWEEFRQAVEAADRRYLKLDTCEIWVLCADAGTFGRLLKQALAWFTSKKKGDLTALLSLAGIEGYDSQSKNFTVGEDDPERFLYGWLE